MIFRQQVGENKEFDVKFMAFPEGIVGPLTLADIHRCILHAMDSAHFDKDVKTLPGYPKVTLD